MAREKGNITRVDVRIPNEIYQKIEQIAIETNQPTHHRSGKPVVDTVGECATKHLTYSITNRQSKDFSLL